MYSVGSTATVVNIATNDTASAGGTLNDDTAALIFALPIVLLSVLIVSLSLFWLFRSRHLFSFVQLSSWLKTIWCGGREAPCSNETTRLTTSASLSEAGSNQELPKMSRLKSSRTSVPMLTLSRNIEFTVPQLRERSDTTTGEAVAGRFHQRPLRPIDSAPAVRAGCQSPASGQSDGSLASPTLPPHSDNALLPDDDPLQRSSKRTGSLPQTPSELFTAKRPSAAELAKHPKVANVRRMSWIGGFNVNEFDLDLYSGAESTAEQIEQNSMGLVCVTLRYDASQQQLFVRPVRARGMRTQRGAVPRVYFKLSLIITGHTEKETQFTKALPHPSTEPVFGDQLQFNLPLSRVKNATLRASVLDAQEKSKSKAVIGVFHVQLGDFDFASLPKGTGPIWRNVFQKSRNLAIKAASHRVLGAPKD